MLDRVEVPMVDLGQIGQWSIGACTERSYRVPFVGNNKKGVVASCRFAYNRLGINSCSTLLQHTSPPCQAMGGGMMGNMSVSMFTRRALARLAINQSIRDIFWKSVG